MTKKTKKSPGNKKSDALFYQKKEAEAISQQR